MNIIRNSSTKLADVLKRSGLAASASDAKRIAGDITTTENKVQSYFDKKKDEMHDDLARKSQNIYVEKPNMKIQEEQASPIQTKEINSIETENVAEKSKNIKEELHNVSKEVKQQLQENNITNPEDHTPVLKEISAVEKEEEQPQTSYDMFEEKNSGQEFIYSHMEKENQPIPNMPQQQIQSFTENKTQQNETIVKPSETIETIMKPSETVKLMENKLEIIEENPIVPETQKNSMVEETKSISDLGSSKTEIVEESKVDLTQMFNFGSKTSAPVQEVQTQKEPEQVVEQSKADSNGITTNNESHPKTGNSESVDILEMFNFAKRGKL